jgi:hypothetical protein
MTKNFPLIKFKSIHLSFQREKEYELNSFNMMVMMVEGVVRSRTFLYFPIFLFSVSQEKKKKIHNDLDFYRKHCTRFKVPFFPSLLAFIQTSINFVALETTTKLFFRIFCYFFRHRKSSFHHTHREKLSLTSKREALVEFFRVFDMCQYYK